MNGVYRKYDKNIAFERGISLSSDPCIFTNSSKASEMRGIMSCGHPVECMSLYSFVYNSILHDKFEIRCPALMSDDPNDKCNKRWTYVELRRMCLLEGTEKDYFELGLNLNRIWAEGDVKPCPKCQNYVKKSPQSPWIYCQACNIRDPNNNSYYCFDCGRDRSDEYKAGESVTCASIQCKIQDGLTFQISKKIVCGESVDSIQRCPNCRIWIEHNGPGYCKIFTCVCKHRFCFLCGKGGNMNSFRDCSVIMGGCKRPQTLEEASKAARQAKLAAQALANKAIGNGDDDMSPVNNSSNMYKPPQGPKKRGDDPNVAGSTLQTAGGKNMKPDMTKIKPPIPEESLDRESGTDRYGTDLPTRNMMTNKPQPAVPVKKILIPVKSGTFSDIQSDD